jgi:hypothetical protein
VIRSLRNIIRYLGSSISTESRHVGSDRYKQDIPSTNSQITGHSEVGPTVTLTNNGRPVP